MKTILLVAALLVLAASANTLSNSALSVRVSAAKDECFFEDVHIAGTRVYMHFSVTFGGALDIDATVQGPDGNLIWSAEKERESRVLFKARLPGPHKFCFSNKMSTLTTKTVAFNVQVGDPAESTKNHAVDPVERSVIHIQEGLQEIKNEQQYLRTRERDHRDTAESTNSRVMWWSIAEIGLIVGMGFGHVYYLKRLFENRRYV